MGHDYDPTDLRADDRRKAEAKRRAIQLAEERKERILWLMGNKLGRAFVWDLIGSARVFHSVFDTSVAIMCRNEGRREVGLELLDWVTACCPDLYQTMVRENGDRSSADRAVNAN